MAPLDTKSSLLQSSLSPSALHPPLSSSAIMADSDLSLAAQTGAHKGVVLGHGLYALQQAVRRRRRRPDGSQQRRPLRPRLIVSKHAQQRGPHGHQLRRAAVPCLQTVHNIFNDMDTPDCLSALISDPWWGRFDKHLLAPRAGQALRSARLKQQAPDCELTTWSETDYGWVIWEANLLHEVLGFQLRHIDALSLLRHSFADLLPYQALLPPVCAAKTTEVARQARHH